MYGSRTNVEVEAMMGGAEEGRGDDQLIQSLQQSTLDHVVVSRSCTCTTLEQPTLQQSILDPAPH